VDHSEALSLLAHIVLCLLLVAVSVAAAVNIVGRRLRRHTVWTERLQLQVQNLHREREARYVQSLQVGPLGTLTPRPPPLADARTTEVSDAMLERLTLESKTRKPE
jgi:hypothetical protein